MCIQGISKLVLIFILIFISLNFVSAIRINEVELNPEGSDSGNEWIELYSQDNANLDGFRIVNHLNKSINLSGSFSGFFVINFSRQWLNNIEEYVMLFNNEGLVDKTPIFKDAFNDNRTWQYCNEWVFRNSTRGIENNCQESPVLEKETKPSESNNEIIDETSKEPEPEEKIEKEEKPETITAQAINENKEAKKDDYGNQETSIIKLGKDIKSYKSRAEYIKEYSIYGFTLFLLALLIILIIWQRKYNEDSGNNNN